MSGDGADAPIDVLCMACDDETCVFEARKMQRRPVGPFDVSIEVMFCGVCHSDLHAAAGHMKKINTPPQYPFVPGHELAGVVIAVGGQVTKLKVGDHAGVGCMVDACLECEFCKAGEEQSCKQRVSTYGASDLSGRAAVVPAGSQTIGGYTNRMVVHEHFAICLPKSYPLEKAGPVMCAGITTYQPLKYFGAGPGTRVAVVGLGGLGVMGIKLAKALGSDVTAVSRSASKSSLALECGADRYIASSDAAQMAAAKGSVDLILDLIPSRHDYRVYLHLLAKGGKIVFLGLNASWGAAMFRGGAQAPGVCKASFIGGIRNTQELIDLCEKHQIFPETTVHPVSKLGDIFEWLDSSNDSGTRHVLDVKGSLDEAAVKAGAQRMPALKPAEGGMDKITIIGEALWMKFFAPTPR